MSYSVTRSDHNSGLIGLPEQLMPAEYAWLLLSGLRPSVVYTCNKHYIIKGYVMFSIEAYINAPAVKNI